MVTYLNTEVHRLDGYEVELNTQGKFYGIILNNKLKCNHRIRHISNKVSESIGIIHRLRIYYLNTTYLLYHLFILTHLNK